MDQRLPETAVTDWRGLCEELVNELQGYASANPYHDSDALVARARAALAEPVAEGVTPSDEELDELYTDIDQSGEPLSWRVFARAVLARWGRPAPAPAGEVAALARRLRMYCTPPNGPLSNDPDARWLTRAADLLEQRHPAPVPVSERKPGPDDCLDEGWAWFFSPRVGWRQAVLPVSPAYTHWLPATALPLPAGEVE